jgi:hypothetical protein
MGKTNSAGSLQLSHLRPVEEIQTDRQYVQNTGLIVLPLKCLTFLRHQQHWSGDHRAIVRPHHTIPLSKAMGSLDKHWPRLIRYLEEGTYLIDNSRTENAILPFL